ncbi:MAG TPA: hypothetical protein VF167_00030 [Longimicrobiaceae bacterium]
MTRTASISSAFPERRERQDKRPWTTCGLTIVVVVALAISAMGIAWIAWAIHKLFHFAG